jgi:4-hydroxy-tetrahydrodipicolinate synthase
MIKPTGSWVAMVTPFNEGGDVDFGALKVLIDRQIKYGTSELFVLGSAAETTLLTLEEKKKIIHEVIGMTKGRIPVFFNCSALTTKDSIWLAKYCESEGADGVIFTVPPYLLLAQPAVFEHLNNCMQATKLPCGIYNNPSRVGVNVNPQTIINLAERNPNFVVDKEAVPGVNQLVEVKRVLGDRLNILCCDAPNYAIVIPTLAVGGSGTANIGGNIIPEESAKYSRPWTSMEIVEECRQEYFKYFPLLKELYTLSNPIVLKAALNILGLPGGKMRAPYQDYGGEKLEILEKCMAELGVIEKYKVD